MPAQALLPPAEQEDTFSAMFADLPNRFEQELSKGAIYF